MSGQYSCEFCSNYVYDEEYEEYEDDEEEEEEDEDEDACVVSMDEDDLAMLMQFKKATCPYFSYGDEYKLARKQ